MSGHVDGPFDPQKKVEDALRFYADERNWLNYCEIRGFPGFHGRQIAANALAALRREAPSDEAKGICAAGSCEFCGCEFRKPSDIMSHRCAAMQEAEVGPLLAARLRAEAENPRPESIVRAERGVVRGLLAEGFTEQHQVTHHDRFEIAVDDLVVRAEVAHPGDAAADLKVENERLRELYENAVGNRERFGWTINHLLECEEALRVAQEEAAEVRAAERDRLRREAGYLLFEPQIREDERAKSLAEMEAEVAKARSEVRAATLREARQEAATWLWTQRITDAATAETLSDRFSAHFNPEAEPKRPRNHAPWCSVEHKGPCDFNQEAE